MPAAVRSGRLSGLARSALVWALGAAAIPLLVASMASGNTDNRAVAAIAVVAGIGAAIAEPFIGLLLFIGLLYVRPEEVVNDLEGMRLALMVSLITFGALIFHNLIRRRPFVRSPLNGMILGFGAMAVLSAVGPGTAHDAFQDISRLVILVFVVINLVRTPARYRAVVITLLTFTCYLAIYSIYLFYAGMVIHQEGVVRSLATGIFADPNDLAATIVAGLALTLIRFRSSHGLIARIVYLAMAAVMVWAIMLTNSRGGMLALIAVLGGFSLHYTRRKTLGMVIGVVAAAVLLAFGPSRMSSFQDEESANNRFWAWDNGFDMVRSHPLLGVGYGGFPDLNGGMTAHNSFVLCYAELGLPGYFFWMGGIYLAYRRSRWERGEGQADADGQEGQKGEAVGGAARAELLTDLQGARLALSGFLVACFWLSRTYVPVLYLLIALPVVAPLAAGATSERRTPQEVNRDTAIIAALCLFSILIIRLVELHYR
jgi:O-antigen ligase